MAAVERQEREQVDDGEDQGDEAEEHERTAGARDDRFVRVLGDPNDAGDFVAGLRARERAPEAGQRFGRHVPHLAERGRGSGGDAEVLGRAEPEADQHAPHFLAVARIHRQRPLFAVAQHGEAHGRRRGAAVVQRPRAAVAVDRRPRRVDGGEAAVHGQDALAHAQRARGRRGAFDREHGRVRGDRRQRGVQLSQRYNAADAAADEDRPEDRERDQDVHTRPGHDHYDPPPGRLGIVGAPAGLRVQVSQLFGVHAGDLHVAARRDRADHVFGLSPANPEQLGREEQREALHAHADGLGDHEVPQLVQHDQRDDAEDRQDPAHGVQCGSSGRPLG